jgi:16S rRNA (guanine527-N7)-methyltransferase
MAALDLMDFGRRLQALVVETLPPSVLERLHRHYLLLLKWNELTSLIGPGTLDQAPEVHYGEALAALPLIPAATAGVLVDVGTGAGFPGLVLAAARPELRVVLVEARERKWAFLRTAIAECGVTADCVLGRVDRTLPPGLPERLDWITLRALKLERPAWSTLLQRLAPEGRVLVWAGGEPPVIPELLVLRRTVSIVESRSKRILELGRT